ncbi:SprT family zinc-dependent metalloprotease [Paenibacillus sp. O199]|uniref:M48 family metallopeptidase n=1 Tax=Paenibacillus sp. O199 TaxID=1643925 RepID=UPI0007BF8F78|nr:SprT family zinc-dependent metalloprotease [Paenibacillus sp. O199]
MLSIEINNHIINCHIEYGKRKKASITMDLPYMVTIKAPNGTGEDMIRQLVAQHGEVILTKSALMQQALDGPQAKEYEEEGKGKFLLFGKEHALHELIDVEGCSEEELRTNLKKFYFAECKRMIGERIGRYQQELKVKPKSVDIVESATKWGSCSWDKKLTFNYRLAMAPLEVIDYVIIHELCHIHHMNHDRSFWRRVGSIMPDYKAKEDYLMRNGRAMTL